MKSTATGRPVTIRLHSSIRHPGQDREAHILEAEGRLIEKAGTSYLQYEEEQNGQKIQTTVKMGTEDALIMRKGAVKMRLPFATDGQRPGEYGTGPASLNLLVRTKELEFAEETETGSGQFAVAYELHADGSLLGTYELTITYTEGTK